MTRSGVLFQQRFPALSERVRKASRRSVAARSWQERSVSASKLLDRWIEGLPLVEDMALALSGVGDGAHIVHLLAALPDGCHLFCAEPDCDAFARFLETDVAEGILKDPRIYIGVGELDNAFFASMASFPVLEVLNVEPLIFAPLYNERRDYFGSFFLQFARQLDYWRKLFGTNVVSSGHWQSNTLANLKTLISAPDVGVLRDAFKGVPMVVASAGPSLDESLEFLRWARKRAVVVAVNSSFRALRNAGIEPHFVLAADPNASTDKGFNGVPLGRALLVCPFIVYPEVARRFVKRTITWSDSSAIVSYLRVKLGGEPGAFVTEQGTVSACAFDLAEIFGCPSIFFTGQDLAARGDGRLHASDTFYADFNVNQTDLSKCRWLPGNTLEQVPVEEKLYVYAKTFEQMARRYGAKLKLINLSRLGARIDGIPYMPLDDARSLMPSVDQGKLESRWQEVEAACTRPWLAWSAILEEMESFRAYVQEVCSTALRAAMRAEICIEESATLVPELGLAREELDEKLAANAHYHSLLEAGQLKLEMLEHQRAVRAINRSKDGRAKEGEALNSYFWAVAEGAYHLLRALDNLDLEVRDHS